jgi:hypothetical protein
MLLVMLSGAVSCKKGTDTPGNNPDDATVYIKSAVYLDTTKAVGLDTFSKSLYIYDGNKRLVRDYKAYYATIGTTVTKNESTLDYIYNGSDVYPAKIIGYSPGSILETFLIYNNNEVIRDSTVPNPNPGTYQLNKYTSLANGSFQWVKRDHNGVLRDSAVYRRTTFDGNILSSEDSLYFAGSTWYRSLKTFNYDNKQNPYKGLLIAYRRIGTYFFAPDAGPLPAGKNNAISYNEVFTNGTLTSTQAATISYTYRSDGLPLTGIVAGNLRFNKILFNYY